MEITFQNRYNFGVMSRYNGVWSRDKHPRVTWRSISEDASQSNEATLLESKSEKRSVHLCTEIEIWHMIGYLGHLSFFDSQNNSYNSQNRVFPRLGEQASHQLLPIA